MHPIISIALGIIIAIIILASSEYIFEAGRMLIGFALIVASVVFFWHHPEMLAFIFAASTITFLIVYLSILTFANTNNIYFTLSL